MREAARLADAGQLRVLDTRRFTLEQVNQAHALVSEAQARGKVVIDIGRWGRPVPNPGNRFMMDAHAGHPGGRRRPQECQETPMKIAILDDYQDAVRHLDCFSLLDGHDVKVFTNTVRGTGQLVARLSPFDAVVLIRERTALTRPLLEKLPLLKLISQTGKVSGHVDVAAATERGIAIVEGVGDPTAPAELTWALIMAAMRRVPQYCSALRAGAWQQVRHPAPEPAGHGPEGPHAGHLGLRQDRSLVAGYGRAFGMQVLVWGREASREQAVKDGYQAAASKEAFFAQADVLSLHLRLNDATRGIVKAADLALMKPTACFVNTSRAELVEPDALEAALAAGRPGLAGLDVFEREPLPVDSPC
jgi:D-3-phosphoglycerate dehydrogenase